MSEELQRDHDPNAPKSGGPKSYSINLSYATRLMKQRGFTQQSLCKLVGVSSVTLHRWMTGKGEITARNLVKLARAMDVDPCRLLDSDDQRAIRHLRDLINRKIEYDRAEDDIPLVDIPTFIAIMKVLGYDQKADGKVPLDLSKLNIPSTDAENQIRDLLDG